MVQIHFQNKQWQKPKEGFEHVTKGKVSIRKTKIKMGTTG